MMKEYGQTNESETEETGWSIGWQERDERKVKTSDKKSRNVLESNLWVLGGRRIDKGRGSSVERPIKPRVPSLRKACACPLSP